MTGRDLVSGIWPLRTLTETGICCGQLSADTTLGTGNRAFRTGTVLSCGVVCLLQGPAPLSKYRFPYNSIYYRRSGTLGGKGKANQHRDDWHPASYPSASASGLSGLVTPRTKVWCCTLIPSRSIHHIGVRCPNCISQSAFVVYPCPLAYIPLRYHVNTGITEGFNQFGY